MVLQRRNPAATFEKAADEPQATAQAQPAPAPAPAQAPAQPPAQQHATGDKMADTSTTGGPAPVQHTGSAQVNQPATPAGVAMVRRDAAAGALSTQVGGRVPPALEDIKGLFVVEYDTFERLKSGSGNIVDSQNNSLGAQIAMTVISWQDSWDLSPGSDTPEAKKVVKYSDDGITVKDTGQDINDYLRQLRDGEVDGVKYPNAAKKPKKVIVGVLEGAEKQTNLLGRTVQVSLSTQSAKTFDRHRFDYTLQMQMGKRASVAGAEKIIITAEARSSNGKNYTLLLVTADE